MELDANNTKGDVASPGKTETRISTEATLSGESLSTTVASSTTRSENLAGIGAWTGSQPASEGNGKWLTLHSY